MDNQGVLSTGLNNQVAVLTASDFSRTMISNGKGSDHAWGNHHLGVELGNWFGAGSALSTVFPNMGRFTHDLGLMAV